jgi:hypothetical protein
MEVQDWVNWFCGVLSASLIYPIWANWVSGGKIKIGQRGIYEPFILALLGGVLVIIGWIVSRQSLGVGLIALSLSMGAATLILIGKWLKGDRIHKEDYFS